VLIVVASLKSVGLVHLQKNVLTVHGMSVVVGKLFKPEPKKWQVCNYDSEQA